MPEKLSAFHPFFMEFNLFSCILLFLLVTTHTHTQTQAAWYCLDIIIMILFHFFFTISIIIIVSILLSFFACMSSQPAPSSHLQVYRCWSTYCTYVVNCWRLQTRPILRKKSDIWTKLRKDLVDWHEKSILASAFRPFVSLRKTTHLVQSVEVKPRHEE